MSAIVEIRCATEAAWLAERDASIGASDVPTLFDEGFVPRERFIAERAAGKRKKPDKRQRMRMDAGKLDEARIGTLFATERGISVYPCGFTIYRNEAIPGLHATPDFWVVPMVTLLETKCGGPNSITKWMEHDGWRWKWLAEPPLSVWIQVQAQFAATGAAGGFVCCAIGSEWNTWGVERDERMVERIAAEVARAHEEINEARKVVAA